MLVFKRHAFAKPFQCLAAPSAACIAHCCGLILARYKSMALCRRLPAKPCSHVAAHAFAKKALPGASRFRAARDKCVRLYVETLPARPMFQRVPSLRGARAKRVRLYVETLPQGQCSTGPPKRARCARQGGVCRGSRCRAARDKRLRLCIEGLSAGTMF